MTVPLPTQCHMYRHIYYYPPIKKGVSQTLIITIRPGCIGTFVVTYYLNVGLFAISWDRLTEILKRETRIKNGRDLQRGSRNCTNPDLNHHESRAYITKQGLK